MPSTKPQVKELDQRLLDELRRRVDRLAEMFDLDALEGHGDSAEEIRRYYEDSRLGYRFVHSQEGAMHMALNPSGTFDRAGYEGQVDLVEKRFSPSTSDVLELACGNGFNLAILAGRNTGRSFFGIDLVESQVKRANAALHSFANASAAVGDFQHLSLGDHSQDFVFVIESFCHATDLPLAFEEVHRVLRPGGLFVVIDAWRTESYRAATEFVQQTAANVELAMAVSHTLVLGDWLETAEQHGFVAVENLDLSDQIMPNLNRLAKGADRFLSHQRVASFARLLLPKSLIQNAVAGYLMPITVELGVHTYRLQTLKRND
ncbi:MAG TPA: class I SAM-dependent methyltransferase [Solirubrobacteraceae bacterium]|jgi:ubiquinone/menaquinone biosynthesis C-methylase UbiE|nr:class I SAM-dependent methyltransferase [Solirubrobacteraceae bacterium]